MRGHGDVVRQSRAKVAAPGWFPVGPEVPTTSASAGLSSGTRGRAADPLGLSRPSNPLRFLAHKPLASRSTRHGDNQSRALGTPPGCEDGSERRASAQRHRKLVRSGGAADGSPAEAFSPLRSLRLASIPARPSTTVATEEADQQILLPAVSQTDRELTPRLDSATRQPRGRLRRLDRREPLPLPPPLHELIQTVADGVFDRDDPLLQLNRASVVQLFMEQWQRQFDANAASFKSIGALPDPALIATSLEC